MEDSNTTTPTLGDSSSAAVQFECVRGAIKWEAEILPPLYAVTYSDKSACNMCEMELGLNFGRPTNLVGWHLVVQMMHFNYLCSWGIKCHLGLFEHNSFETLRGGVGSTHRRCSQIDRKRIIRALTYYFGSNRYNRFGWRDLCSTLG